MNDAKYIGMDVHPKSLPTLHGLESRAQIFAPSSRRGVFSLDSPLYREHGNRTSPTFQQLNQLCLCLADGLTQALGILQLLTLEF